LFVLGNGSGSPCLDLSRVPAALADATVGVDLLVSAVGLYLAGSLSSLCCFYLTVGVDLLVSVVGLYFWLAPYQVCVGMSRFVWTCW
jgi:hypothetical protein